MPIKIHNTLSGTKEDFKPLKKGSVTMYNCGPTVYDHAHIGNFRTFIMSDIIRRVFEYEGYKVKQAMNITDVDDKTIRRSREENVSLAALTEKYEKLFWDDMESLSILKPHKILGARENVGEMIKMIAVLLKKGVAYQATDGIYVSIDKVKNYGKLAHIKIAAANSSKTGKENREHGRIANDEYDKENPRDFAIWKFSVDDDGISESVAWSARSATDVQAGTLNVRQCQSKPSEKQSTSTPAAPTSFFRIIRTKSPNPNPRPAKHSSTIGSTAAS